MADGKGMAVSRNQTLISPIFTKMSELLYKQEVFQLVGFCMEIHRELGKGHSELIYKDALVVELRRAAIPFLREKNYQITYKGVILPHYYYADFVVWDKFFLKPKPSESSLIRTPSKC